MDKATEEQLKKWTERIDKEGVTTEELIKIQTEMQLFTTALMFNIDENISLIRDIMRKSSNLN